MKAEEIMDLINKVTAKLAEAAPANDIIYQPRFLQELTYNEMKALYQTHPEAMTVQRYGDSATATMKVNGVFVSIKTAYGSLPQMNENPFANG